MLGQVGWNSFLALLVMGDGPFNVEGGFRDDAAWMVTLTWIATIGSHGMMVVSGVLLARSFLLLRRSLVANRSQLGRIALYLNYSAVAFIIGFVGIVWWRQAYLLTPIGMVVVFLPNPVWIALNWNGLRVLHRAADAARG